MEQTLSNPGRLDYQRSAAYVDASPEAQATIDAVRTALARFTSPEYGLDVGPGHNPALGVSFEWHDGAAYRVLLNRQGELLRLFRLQYTGGWEWDEVEGRDVPEEAWRTVRVLSKDRAGKVLRNVDRPAAKSWAEAAAR